MSPISSIVSGLSDAVSLTAALPALKSTIVGVNPKLTEVEGVPCHASLRAIPGAPRAVSIVAPPAAAAAIVADAQAAGVQHLWFQPGAEDATAIAAARAAGIHVIAFGPCLLVALGYRDD